MRHGRHGFTLAEVLVCAVVCAGVMACGLEVTAGALSMINKAGALRESGAEFSAMAREISARQSVDEGSGLWSAVLDKKKPHSDCPLSFTDVQMYGGTGHVSGGISWREWNIKRR